MWVCGFCGLEVREGVRLRQVRWGPGDVKVKVTWEFKENQERRKFNVVLKVTFFALFFIHLSTFIHYPFISSIYPYPHSSTVLFHFHPLIHFHPLHPLRHCHPLYPLIHCHPHPLIHCHPLYLLIYLFYLNIQWIFAWLPPAKPPLSSSCLLIDLVTWWVYQGHYPAY